MANLSEADAEVVGTVLSIHMVVGYIAKCASCGQSQETSLEDSVDAARHFGVMGYRACKGPTGRWVVFCGQCAKQVPVMTGQYR